MTAPKARLASYSTISIVPSTGGPEPPYPRLLRLWMIVPNPMGSSEERHSSISGSQRGWLRTWSSAKNLKTTGTGRSISSETSILTAMDDPPFPRTLPTRAPCVHCIESCEVGSTSENLPSSSTLAIVLHSKPHLLGLLGCPLDFLRVGVGDPHAESPRGLHGLRSPPLVPTSRNDGTQWHNRTELCATQPSARSHGLALSGRWELRRRDRIAGGAWPPPDDSPLSGWALSDTIHSDSNG